MQQDMVIVDAKKTIKHHIKFLESLKFHIGGTDPILRSRALWTAWCLHRYINNDLIKDIENAMKEHSDGVHD